MDHDLVVDRQVAGDGVGQLIGTGGDEPTAHREQVPGVLAAEVLAERQRPADARVDRELRRAGEVVVDLVVHNLPFDHTPAIAHIRRRDRAALHALVAGVIRTQGPVELQPRDREVFGADVAEHATDV